MSAKPIYKRILLKLSGEALMGDQGYGIDPATITRIAQEVNDVHNLGVEVAIVVGGGNIFRGLALSAKGMDRAGADYMGMLATVLNGIALQDALENQNAFTRLMSAIEMHEVAEPFIRRRAVRHGTPTCCRTSQATARRCSSRSPTVLEHRARRWRGT